jgi:hypothetical protein
VFFPINVAHTLHAAHVMPASTGARIRGIFGSSVRRAVPFLTPARTQ